MPNTIKYTLLLLICVVLTFPIPDAHGAEAEIPVTVTVINCLDSPDDERCRKFTQNLNEIAPDAGDYHPPEWTSEEEKQEPVMEHFE